MNKINWGQKLTSRKFWMAIIAFITSVLLGIGMDAGVAEKITSAVMAGATAIAYIIGEGLVDANRPNDNKNNEIGF